VKRILPAPGNQAIKLVGMQDPACTSPPGDLINTIYWLSVEVSDISDRKLSQTSAVFLATVVAGADNREFFRERRAGNRCGTYPDNSHNPSIYQ
jgi:hypothetical protein